MVEVIAELCQNHNGDKSIMAEMVYAAAESGATYAKIQSMRADDLPFRERFEEGVSEGGVIKTIKRPHAAEFNRLKPLDLSDDDHFQFIEHCERAGIKPLTTVFSRYRVPFVAQLGMDTIKVASFDCSSFPMLKELREQNIPRLIVSTGITFDQEIEQACKILAGTNFALLHCISIYPTPLQEAHLRRIQYLKGLCPAVGISDHSNPEIHGSKLTAGALLMGATIVEKHFTILPKDKTRDGPVSANPKQLRELVRLAGMTKSELQSHVKSEVPEFDAMLGSERRELSATELLNRDYYRGRFASKSRSGEWIYNWEDRALE
jgi:N,N'-diacetyllegionaminate synthase